MSFFVAALLALSPAAAQEQAHDHAAMAAQPGAKRSMIQSSTPADGAMLNGPPPTFDVTFVHPMTLKSVVILDGNDAQIAVTAKPEAVDASSARIALPVLKPGTYVLRWVGVGGSGREMRGELSFMVH